MKKYIINEIYSDGYERFAIIEGRGDDVKLNVHFFEYDEYISKSQNLLSELGIIIEREKKYQGIQIKYTNCRIYT